MASIEELLKEKTGVNLDIGGGGTPQPGSINIDILDLPEVDIVWDLEQTPWPIPDECVHKAYASHVLEHISPIKGTFINVMNEIWRVLKPGGQFAFVVPYGSNELYVQDPTHCNPISEITMYYFDPDPDGKFAGQSLYRFYQPKPWKIQFMAYERNGVLEVLLQKRKDDRSYHEEIVDDIVKDVINVTKSLERG